MEARLTKHATQRLAERTTLTHDKLFGLIHNQLCVIVGIEPFSNRLHKLIYSESDKTHFVVIQDMANGEVITILPLDYHENLAWKISEKKLQLAVFKVSPELHSSLYPEEEAANDPSIRCSFQLTLFLNSPGLQSIRKSFGSHQFSKRPTSADDALSDPEFVDKLMQRFSERQIPIRAVEHILLADSKHDYILIIPWVTLESFEDDIEISVQGRTGQPATTQEAKTKDCQNPEPD